MNQKTARLLRKFSSVSRESYRDGKKRWLFTPRNKRGKVRGLMQTVIARVGPK